MNKAVESKGARLNMPEVGKAPAKPERSGARPTSGSSDSGQGSSSRPSPSVRSGSAAKPPSEVRAVALPKKEKPKLPAAGNPFVIDLRGGAPEKSATNKTKEN